MSAALQTGIKRLRLPARFRLPLKPFFVAGGVQPVLGKTVIHGWNPPLPGPVGGPLFPPFPPFLTSFFFLFFSLFFLFFSFLTAAAEIRKKKVSQKYYMMLRRFLGMSTHVDHSTHEHGFGVQDIGVIGSFCLVCNNIVGDTPLNTHCILKGAPEKTNRTPVIKPHSRPEYFRLALVCSHYRLCSSRQAGSLV